MRSQTPFDARRRLLPGMVLLAAVLVLPASVAVAEDAEVLVAMPETPLAAEPAEQHLGSGVASYYARRFEGRRTASGEAYSHTQLTAAHRSLPFGSLVRVINPGNGRSVVVRINDRGPFHANRVIDLSGAAAEELGLIARGSGLVELTLLEG